LWDGGDLRFCGQKQTLITYDYCCALNFHDFIILTKTTKNGICGHQNKNMDTKID
jgi:hypothetical protein